MRGLGQSSTQTYLDLISQYESNNRNIVNYRYNENPAKYSAQGYYQITNTNWLTYGPAAGVDTSIYPNAMSAPQDVQAQVAAYLLTQTPAGIANWGGNPQLMAALSASGLQTSGTVTDGGTVAVASGNPIVDLMGAAANTPTSDILSQLDVTAASIIPGMDFTGAGIVLALGAAVLVYFAMGRR